MALFDSKVAKFLVTDSGGTADRDLSTYITAIGGLPGARNLNEATALGDSGATFHPGLENVTISLSGQFDDTATTGPEAVLGPLRTHTAAVAFSYGPKGSASSALKYSGTCWVTEFTVDASVGSLVLWTASLQVEGQVTRGAFS
jgi:hypothetical protein